MSKQSAAAIIDAVGGAANVESLTHCATRLRFELKDASGVNQATLEGIQGVLGAVPQAGNRYQVVIGGAVQTVYNEIYDLPAFKGRKATADARSAEDIKAEARAKGPRGKFAWIDSVFEYLSDSFRPILGALLGASLFITFMALMASLKVIPAWNAPGVTLPVSWQFVNLCWQSVFVFLPLMVAYNAAKKVGADPWVGFAVMAVTMLPGFTALGADKSATTLNFVAGNTVQVVQIFGLPLTVFNYSSQVFPPLIMAAVLGLLYKGLRKIIPDNVQMVFVPFLSMLIMIPLTAFIIGPFGVYTGAGLAQVLKSINDFSPLIFAIVIPLAYPFMVPLGLHWPINAIMLLNIQTLGFDFIQGPMGAWNFACFGATAGVLVLAWREKDQMMKQTATGALAAGLLGGISEPSLYGIHLRFKRIYPRMLVGCLVGGLIIGLGGGVHASGFAFTSLLTIPIFTPNWLYAVAIAAAFFTSMFLVIGSGYKNKDDAAAVAAAGVSVEELETRIAGESAGTLIASSAAKKAAAEFDLLAPVTGTVIPLSEVPDQVFAAGTMGPGLAINPSGKTVVAPGDGTVVTVQNTGHAIGLALDNGAEVLIHIGIDTVKLAGAGFVVKVKVGDRVTAGQTLLTFDPAVIKAAGYSLITPLIVLNPANFAEVAPVLGGKVKAGDPVVTVSAKSAVQA